MLAQQAVIGICILEAHFVSPIIDPITEGSGERLHGQVISRPRRFRFAAAAVSLFFSPSLSLSLSLSLSFSLFLSLLHTPIWAGFGRVSSLSRDPPSDPCYEPTRPREIIIPANSSYISCIQVFFFFDFSKFETQETRSAFGQSLVTQISACITRLHRVWNKRQMSEG